MKRDGHIHTPYCPHGSADSFEQYINQAIELGFSEITFTEHAPLPNGFIDPTPDQDSGMDPQFLEDYLRELKDIQTQFRNDITIKIGLEVDFIIGFENETEQFLTTYGPELDDSILSVHFLKNDGQYYCIDYSDNMFETMIQQFGTIEQIYKDYYTTVIQSIYTPLGKYKPNRIGHITLAHKFQKKFPCQLDEKPFLKTIISEMKKAQLELDYNGAGLFKSLCSESYPPKWVVELAKEQNVPFIFGSDAHCANDLGRGFTELFKINH